MFSDTWRYSHFPSTCPFAKYLPESAVPTKCEYEGLVDFAANFQAEGTLADMDFFKSGIRDSLTNARLDADADAEASVTGARLGSENRVQLRADHGVFVYFEWAEDTIYMFYHDG
ncbi:MAG: hypothetical protein ACI92Z_002776 [Paracoccaceae bacterium]|jgi:hypothetical protein